MENISKLDVFDRKHHNHCRRNIKAVSLKDFTFLLKKIRMGMEIDFISGMKP